MRGWSTWLLVLALLPAVATAWDEIPAAEKAAAAPIGTNPKALSTPAPQFPEGLKNPRRGTVVLQMKVRTDGGTDEVAISRSSGEPAFDQAALATAKDWRFQPATNAAGEAVESTIRVPVTFAPPASADDLAAGVRDVLKQPCSNITTELATFRQRHPDGKLEDMPTFKASTGMIFATVFGRPADQMIKLIKYWNATLPVVYAKVSDECAAHPAAVYEDVWAAALKSEAAPQN